VEYNPLFPEVREDPYPYYEALRRDEPVYRVDALGVYAVSRYEDVLYVLMHPELFSSTGMPTFNIGGEPVATVINTDPPDHVRLRSIVNRAFTPKIVADLEPRIRAITGELIDAVAPAGEMDLIGDLAMPLPVRIIAELLGVEPERKDDFKRWSDNVVYQIGASQEDAERMDGELEGFDVYFEGVVEERRREPRNDLISALIQAHEQDAALTSNEVLAFIALLLIAGNETTTNLLGNAMLALLANPDQLELVQDDHSLIPNLVEEALRYDAPVQFLFRKTTRDVAVAGTLVPKDAAVLPLFGSANRDDRRYPDAARFDVTRDTQGHVAFGHGIHFCLGAPLARLEARIALGALLGRMRNLSLNGRGVQRIESIFLRGPKRLPLTFEAVPAGLPA
jgi:cytochrome P450